MKIEMLREKLEQSIARTAWGKGVKLYAFELLENFDHEKEFSGSSENKIELLNGAKDWSEYSWGGCSLIYDYDIAERLCTPSELKKVKNGERNPNSREQWLDVQARALYQAFLLLIKIVRW